MKILNIPTLSQRDPRWAGQRLGMVDGVTIGDSGCVDTSQSMLMTFHEHPILPNQLDDILTEKGLYYDAEGNGPTNDDLWVPNNISKVFTDMKYVSTTYCYTTPAPIQKIKDAIDRNQPPTLWLMNGGVAHNVLAVGYDGDQIYVNDPWMGDQVRIDKRWGDSATVILSVDYYEGPMPEATITIPVSINEGNVFKATQHDKTCKTWGFNDPRNTTSEDIDATIQKSINAYKGQASSAEAAKAEVDTKLAASEQEVKNRIEQVGRLTEQMTKDAEVYQAEIDALKNKPQEDSQLVITLRAQVGDYKGKYEAAMKEKGTALNELATVKTQLQICQKGIKTQSLWETIVNFLKGTRVQIK